MLLGASDVLVVTTDFTAVELEKNAAGQEAEVQL
jgi:hypothetical protein